MKNYIKKYRKKKKMKQEELGEKIGISQQLMSSYENGKTRISINLAMQICEILEQPIEKVFPKINK